ncbi:hypothetical protein CAI21_13590 [Alkalilimnicola ehrlichii]|uniref:Ornithine cyclodeaminase n=1 Tax=Alkalilimnicola ehrlichii TaxID=351052 RepID=A0A3E0WNQ3_9GAMM|nr:ornithine cyclodeaminase family protein [Alkalilimnicola ehrlichii]RFA27950.1 hypothetical protein CAI21_13590 [Alkalilimnicola ehrlichii]RFA34594.1 hypothetical protein CAL65_14610 [Alkalilimnicola ehrlichii]
MMTKTLLLSQDDIARIIAAVGRDRLMDLIIARLSEGLSRADDATSETPARSGFVRGEDAAGVLEWMPHHQVGQGITIKTVAYTPSNPSVRGAPTITGVVGRFDVISGRLEALTDGIFLTALRTGAASAVASRLLARPDSRVVGLIGTGAQAVTQLHALTRVFPIERVLVFDICRAHQESFRSRVEFLGLSVEAAALPELERNADIICTATSVGVGEGPVLAGEELQGHAHINAVGSDLPGKTELPREVLMSALVCPDHPEQALREGECQQLDRASLGPDLASLCRRPELGAKSQGRLTVFDSTGFALEDHIALDVLLEIANDLGIGTSIQLEHFPKDPLNPYAPSASAGLSMPTSFDVAMS